VIHDIFSVFRNIKISSRSVGLLQRIIHIIIVFGYFYGVKRNGSEYVFHHCEWNLPLVCMCTFRIEPRLSTSTLLLHVVILWACKPSFLISFCENVSPNFGKFPVCLLFDFSQRGVPPVVSIRQTRWFKGPSVSTRHIKHMTLGGLLHLKWFTGAGVHTSRVQAVPKGSWSSYILTVPVLMYVLPGELHGKWNP